LPWEFLILPPMQCDCRIALGIAQHAITENAYLQNSLISFNNNLKLIFNATFFSFAHCVGTFFDFAAARRKY
jgi:hypothetical protein